MLNPLNMVAIMIATVATPMDRKEMRIEKTPITVRFLRNDDNATPIKATARPMPSPHRKYAEPLTSLPVPVFSMMISATTALTVANRTRYPMGDTFPLFCT